MPACGCEAGLTATGGVCGCESGTAYVAEAGACVTVADRFHDKPPSCTADPGFGNPIHPLSGVKRLQFALGGGPGLVVRLGYDTRSMEAAAAPLAAPAFGPLWQTNVHKRLVFQSSNVQAIQAARGLGVRVSFVKTASGAYQPEADLTDRLEAVPGGWRYVDAAARAEELYDAAGTLQRLTTAAGATLTFHYSDATTPASEAPKAGLLIAVQDAQGRTVQFAYAQPGDPALAPRITRLVDAAGHLTQFQYDAAGNLQHILWPDTTGRQFLYEDPRHPWALTGVLDENAQRIATYGYDDTGRAISTEGAGGVNRYAVTWGTPPGRALIATYDAQAGVLWRDHYWRPPGDTVVHRPNGEAIGLGAQDVFGMARLTSQSQPAGSGCAASARTQAYDAHGNVIQADDFNGHRVCAAYDLARNLETVRVEGLANTTTCPDLLAAGASLPAGSRKTSTRWHRAWQLPVQLAEPGRLTTWVYHGTPDPATGSHAACAPADAQVTPGVPIAVVCEKRVQATTDPTGAAGFAAEPVGSPRVWRYTYDRYGNVLTEDGPRTDVADVTTYAHWPDDALCPGAGEGVGMDKGCRGQLRRVTNALGHVTEYLKYDAHGQLLHRQESGGAESFYNYDLRQRLVERTEAGLTTGYHYDQRGLLTQVTLPDASAFSYEYDAAHRLTGIGDSLGNRVRYTLDAAGNRVGEQFYDSHGQLKKTLSRAFDALGRLQTLNGVAPE